jgi:hypothetical protein
MAQDFDQLIREWSKGKITSYSAIDDQCQRPLDVKIYFQFRYYYWDAMTEAERRYWAAHWNVVALQDYKLKKNKFNRWALIAKGIMERKHGTISV